MKFDFEARHEKIQRLRSGERPRALELCSGCGGMSLGMAAAGFDLVAHVEQDATAAATYALNFKSSSVGSHEQWAKPRDMVATEPSTLIRDLGLTRDVSRTFDILAAGLPCQAFARIGRSKLRSVTGDMYAFKNDSRAKLYQRFLQYVDEVQPVALIIENVPDILNFGGHNVPEEICETLEHRGYVARYALLNSAFYGVPQMRDRLFLVAVDASLGIEPTFPIPTHSLILPSGYERSRTVAMKHIPVAGSHFVDVPRPTTGLLDAVTVKSALEDLPRIREHFSNPAVMKRRKISEELPYNSKAAPSDYALKMRGWMPNRRDMANGHMVRVTPRDFETFAKMAPGGEYPHAYKVAESLFEKQLNELWPIPRIGSKRYLALRKSFVPPYDPGKFPNKWWKLDPKLPSRTLTAHMGKDTYSHIHWDSRQKRSISVREAARLQSFPDGFQFSGAMNAAFRQIGNAVPPMLAQAVAARVKDDIASAIDSARSNVA